MNNQPSLETARLRLRPFCAADAPAVARLAGRREIADTTISIPHPFSGRQVREWISRQAKSFTRQTGVSFGLELKSTGQLIGAVVLRDIDREHSQAELSLWVGVESWGQGYATEAAAVLLRFGFEQLDLNRIYGHHMARNPASGRVLEKIGMRREGLLRHRVRKWGVFEDVLLWAVLRGDVPGSAARHP